MDENLLVLSQENFAQREPLTTRLRGLVRSYPKGVGLVYEFVQNADDAGAQQVHVYLDNRIHSTSRLPTTSMSDLQGPAFVVVNDAQFSDRDWTHIQQIGESGKALETTKTGHFGLGFNSVYNVTDFPMLLTGARIGIFDPHGQTVYGASVDRPGNAWRLGDVLWSHCSDLLSPFELFGLMPHAKEFDGTIFRLPIRTEAHAGKSEICQQPFTETDFYAIVDKLHDTLPDLLVFLRTVHAVDVSVVKPDGRIEQLLSVHTINRDSVELARKRVRDVLSLPHEALLSNEDWISHVFEYLSRHSDQIILDQDRVRKLPMVPDQSGKLHAMGLASTPLLPSSESPKSLISALYHLGVPIVSGSDKLMKAVRRFSECFQGIAIWSLTPVDLIDTLHSVRSSSGSVSPPSPSFKDATAILDFLSSPRGVRDLKAHVDRVPKLRALRIFPTTTGEIVSLVSEERYISADYSLPRFAADVGLLSTGKENGWIGLYHVLGVQRLTRARLITSIVLPRIDDLSSVDCHRLLVWLRANLPIIRETEDPNTVSALIQRLGEVLRVQCTDARVRPPRLLYHPESDFAAALLGSRTGFPDGAIYRDRADLWLEFFATLGMERLLRPTDIVSAIDDLIASEAPKDEKANKLQRIAEYIDEHWEGLKNHAVYDTADASITSFCEELKQRSWLPALTTAPRGFLPELLSNWEKRLFRPSELLTRTTLPIVSSVRPVCQTNRVSQMQADIGLRAEPDLDDALAQLENLTQVASNADTPVSDRVAGIFTDIYSFVGMHFEGVPRDELDRDDRVSRIRNRVAQLPCILDGSRKLWPPNLCFAEPVNNFLGLRVRVRAESEHIDRGLFILGRRERPSTPDYISFFRELYLQRAGNPVSDNDRDILRSAYLSAALSATSTECRGCPLLLETGVLSDEKAIFDNAPWLSERARSAGLVFVDPSLAETVIDAFGVSLLSSAVYERPIEENPSVNPDFLSTCAALEARLRAPLFHKGVCRLIGAAGPAAQPKAIDAFFDGINVIAASALTTALVWADSGIQIPRSTGSCDLVFDPERKGFVISEEAADVLFERLGSVLSNELRYDGHDLKEFASCLIAILRVEPEQVDSRLTKLRVPQLIDNSEGTRAEEDSCADYLDESLGWHDDSELTDENIPSLEQAESATAPAIVAPEEENDALRPECEIRPAPSDQHERDLLKAASRSDKGGPPRSEPVMPAVPETEIMSSAPVPSSYPSGTSLSRPSAQTSRDRAIGQKSRSVGGAPHRGRARSYVSPSVERHLEDSEQAKEHRSRVEKAAVRKAMQIEEEHDRRPKEMPPLNEGYDIESYAADGTIERYIEVKGLSGTWSELGVAVSREQFRKATKEGASFYLYVVEFALEPSRARVFAIQDPANKVDEFWFDNGWIDYAETYGHIDPTTLLTEGTVVLVDGQRRAVVVNIDRRGALMLLELDFGGGVTERVVYSPRRIRVIHNVGAEVAQ